LFPLLPPLPNGVSKSGAIAKARDPSMLNENLVLSSLPSPATREKVRGILLSIALNCPT